MLRAELFIAAEDFLAARKAIGELAETDPTARVLTIMAAVERGMGSDDAVVKGWLARALSAPRGPQWVCDNCDRPHAAWTPVCESCASFDTLSWKRPKDSVAALPAGAEMLPLIVGQIEGLSEDTGPSGEADTVEVAEAEVLPNDPEGVENIFSGDDGDTADTDLETANADGPPLDFAVEKDTK